MTTSSYMRTTLLAEDDPRRETSGYFLEPATVADVLDGLDRRVAEGYVLDEENFATFLQRGPHHVDADTLTWCLSGNFADLSAAFCVEVSAEQCEEVTRRLKTIIQQSRSNLGAKQRGRTT